MEQSKVYSIMMQYKELIPAENLPQLQRALENASDCVYERVSFLPTRSPLITLLLSVFCGAFGVDRFYIGDIGLGITKLLLCTPCIIFTFGIGSLWTLLDIYFCYEKAKKMNFDNLMREISM